MQITKKEWKLILVSLEGGRLEAGAMAEERVSGFVDIPLQDKLEKPYKELMKKIKKRLDK
tara:strand:- start:448 stop:627 length:180 start_codon:yes stop_codon:yes gene_type:complete